MLDDDGFGVRRFAPGNYTLPGSPTGCVTSSREIFSDPLVDPNDYTRWDGHFLNWYFSSANATAAAQMVATNNGSLSACLGGGTFSRYRRTRVTAAKTVLREVICQVNAAGSVRFGIAQFRRAETGDNDPNGGFVAVPINDYLVAGAPNVYSINGTSRTHGAHLDFVINDLTGESWTPLAESLFQIYTYFHGRSNGESPVGADGSTNFPVYEYDATLSSGGTVGGLNDPSDAPASPVQWECQKNFVVIITDGESTRDDFDEEDPTDPA